MTDSPHKTKAKDMYWFAHGGEPLPDKNHQLKSDGDEELGSPEQHNSPSWKPLQDRKVLPEEARNASNGKECASVGLDGADSSPLLSLTERDDRVAVTPNSYGNGARMLKSSARASRNAEDEKSKKITEAEQDKNNGKVRRKVDREATLEARRNAQRSNVSFAFGSSLPRNLDLDVTTVYQGSDLDRNKRRNVQATVSSSKPGPVTNIVPKTKKEGWADMPGSLFATSENTQSEKTHSWISVNQPKNSLVGSGAFVADDRMSQSMISPVSACRGRRKTDLTPTIPYDRTAPPRTPVPPASSGKRSVSMTRLDQLAQPRRSYVEAQRDHAKANSTSSTSSAQKDLRNSPSRPRSSASEHSAGSNRPSTTPPVNMRARTTSRKPRPISIAGTIPDRRSAGEIKKDFAGNQTPEKKSEISATTKKASTVTKAKSPAPKNVHEKPGQKSPIKHLTPKASPIRKLPAKAKKSTAVAQNAVAEPVNSPAEETPKVSATPPESPPSDEEQGSVVPESSGKRIISEEEAKAALAEKRRLAREQAEKEAELERQHQEELRLEEEERIRKEEEEQRKMEEEHLHLLEEHRKQEEEKLRKAIEEQERKEQEEKQKREEEARLKAEQERKAKEEAERQRIELEEKLRKEEEERAERKKRLEKIMSRTRGKGASPSSHSGGDQSDSADSQAGDTAEALSGNSSLNSIQSTDPSSGGASLEFHPEDIPVSENESLNSMDMMALSENSSLDSNLLMLPSEGGGSLDSDQASTISNQNLPSDEKPAEECKTPTFDHISSKDTSAESYTLFNASGDNPASNFNKNDTVNNTNATIVPNEEKNIQDCLPLTVEFDEKVETASEQLLDFNLDFVETLVSQSGNSISSGGIDVLASDQVVMENFATYDTSCKISDMPTPAKLEDFASETEDTVVKSEVKRDPQEIHEICVSEHQETIENFTTNPFIMSSEPVTELRNDKQNEMQDANKSILNSDNYKAASNTSVEGVNFVHEDLNFSMLMTPSEEVHLDEEHHSDSANLVETSSLENLAPSPVSLKEEERNVVVQDDTNSSTEICVGVDKEYAENISEFQSYNFTSELSDKNSDQYLGNAEMSVSLNLDATPFTQSEAVPSDCSSVLFKEISDDIAKTDEPTNITPSVEELESSAIHSVHSGVNLCDEHLAYASVTDSEDSSLDSNLSQVMNVNINDSTTSSAETNVLNTSLMDIGSETHGKTSTSDVTCVPLQKIPQYIDSGYVPTTNGYQNHVVESFVCDNGVDGDGKTSSIIEDCHSVSPQINNEMNSNLISSVNSHHVENILNSGDINFNKVPSNPFVDVDDTNVVSENQFNQGEIMRNTIQTEFHS